MGSQPRTRKTLWGWVGHLAGRRGMDERLALGVVSGLRLILWKKFPTNRLPQAMQCSVQFEEWILHPVG